MGKSTPQCKSNLLCTYRSNGCQQYPAVGFDCCSLCRCPVNSTSLTFIQSRPFKIIMLMLLPYNYSVCVPQQVSVWFHMPGLAYVRTDCQCRMLNIDTCTLYTSCAEMCFVVLNKGKDFCPHFQYPHLL